MNRSFIVFLLITLIAIVLGGMRKDNRITYYKDDILCDFKIPITCGVEKTLLCSKGVINSDEVKGLTACNCDPFYINPKYGYKINIDDECNMRQIPMNGYELLLLGMQIDINTCSKTDLMAINGIGEKIASRIISERERVKRFERIEDLLKVVGINKKTLNKISRFLCIDCRR